MTRLMKFISLTILFSFLLYSLSFGQDQQKTTLDDLKNQVKEVEEQVGEMKVDIVELQKLKEELKDDHDKLKLLEWIFGPLIFLSLAGGLLYLLKSFGKIAEKKAKEKYENLFNDEKERLIDLIRKENEEYQLKQGKSILVISHPGSKDNFIREFFRKMKFDLKNIQFSNIEDIKNPNKNKEDLVLFYDEDDKLSEKDIFDVIAKTKATIINFYFGPKRINPGEYIYKTSFANARVQLYGNLINALRYQKLLK